MLYKLLVKLLILTTVLDASPLQLLSPQATKQLLETIKDDAIILGNGHKEVHSFIDPKCAVSQRYIKYLITKRNSIFKRYKIYLYLYELHQKHSANIIQNVFDSDYPVILLKEIMIDKNLPLSEFDEDLDDEVINSRILRIEKVAKQIGVFKRPYIITNGRGK